jgi:hypothetical protein
VHESNQPQGEREFVQFFETKIHGTYVIDYFPNVVGELRVAGVEFVRKDVLESALSTLDLRTVDSLSSYIHSHEQIRIGEGLRNTVKPPDGQISSRKFLDETS